MPLRARVNLFPIYNHAVPLLASKVGFWESRQRFHLCNVPSNQDFCCFSNYCLYFRNSKTAKFPTKMQISMQNSRSNCCVTNVFLNNANFSTFVHRPQLWLKLKYFFEANGFLIYLGIRLLVDAEYTYMNPGISAVALGMMLAFNQVIWHKSMGHNQTHAPQIIKILYTLIMAFSQHCAHRASLIFQESPVVWNTYQCYLKQALNTISAEMKIIQDQNV